MMGHLCSWTMMAPPPAPQMLKQRRVSLALESSPRIVPAWDFRDDSGLDAHFASSSKETAEKRGKMRKITAEQLEQLATPFHVAEKRQRKKWTEEETNMLVEGCNTVSRLFRYHAGSR